MSFDVASAVGGVDWPAVPNGRGSQILAIAFQLEKSQWLAAAEIAARQRRQVLRVLDHAYKTIPFYRRRFDRAGFRPALGWNDAAWSRIEPLTRVDTQRAGGGLLSRNIPKEHGQVAETATSGSTGEPVRVKSTALCGLFWNAFALRELLWRGCDFKGKLAVIRWTPPGKGRPPNGEVADNWGSATYGVVDTGPCVTLSIQTDPGEQAAWLARQDPEYLLTYPSALRPLMRALDQRGLKLSRLRVVRTIAETCPAELRSACGAAWGAPVCDLYSSQECGYIAVQCPTSPLYHVQSENVLVEILDDTGRPCAAGELGRVVVTTLHNFAMPLVRYEIGDWATPADACRCGRGLPILESIAGRRRNLAILPDGRRRPIVLSDLEDLAVDTAIRGYQLVQRARDAFELSLVAARPLTADEERRASDCVERALGWQAPVGIRYVDSIPRGPGGKFEDFRCDIPVDDP